MFLFPLSTLILERPTSWNFCLSEKHPLLLKEANHNRLWSLPMGLWLAPTVYHLVSSILDELPATIYIDILSLMQLSEESWSVSKFYIYRKRKREGSLFCYFCFLSWSYSASISLLSYTLILARLLARNCLMTLKIAYLIFCLVHRPASLGLGLLLNGMPWESHQKWKRNKLFSLQPKLNQQQEYCVERVHSEWKLTEIIKSVSRPARYIPSVPGVTLSPPALTMKVAFLLPSSPPSLLPFFPPFLLILQLIEHFLRVTHSEALWLWRRVRYGLSQEFVMWRENWRKFIDRLTAPDFSFPTCQSVRLALTNTQLSHFGVLEILLWNANLSIQFPWISACCLEGIWFSFSPSALYNHSYLYAFLVYFFF